MHINNIWQRGFLLVFLPVVGATVVVGDTKDTDFDSPIHRLEASEFRLIRSPGGRHFCFSGDGGMIAGANWGDVKLWTFPEGKLIRNFASVVQTWCVGFSDDNRDLLALNRKEKAIYRFDVATGELRTKVALQESGKKVGYPHYYFSGDGRWLCGAGWTVSVWDTATGKQQLGRIRPGFSSVRAAISDKAVLTLWDRSFLARYDVLTGKRLSKTTHLGRLHGLISDLEGVRFAAYSSEAEAVVFWDPSSFSEGWVGGKIPMTQREWSAKEAMISDDRSRLVFKAPGQKHWIDNTMAVFDISRGEIVSSFKTPEIPSIGESVISPDGKYVFPTGNRSVFCPINVETTQLVRKIDGHVDEIQSLSFTPNGRRLLVASRSKRQAWSTETGQPTRLLSGYSPATPAVVAVDDHQALVSGGQVAEVRLHDIDTGKVIRRYESGSPSSPSDLQIGKDRKTFTAAVRVYDGFAAKRWNIETGRLEAESQISRTQGGVAYGPFQLSTLALGGSRVVRVEQPVKGPASQLNLVFGDWTDGSDPPSITRRLELPALQLTAISCSTDNRYLAATVNDTHNSRMRAEGERPSSYLVVWDLVTNKRKACVKREQGRLRQLDLRLVTISSDGNLAATVSRNRRIEVWGVSSEKLLQTFMADPWTKVIEFNSDGSMLASGHVDGRVNLWDTSKAKAKLAN